MATHAPVRDNASSLGIMDRLKTETRSNHDQAEQNGFGVRVMDGGLTIELYVEHLAAWHEMLSHLEQALRTSSHPMIASVWHEGLAKQELLTRDLDHFDSEPTSLDPSVSSAVRDFMGMVDDYAGEDPASLLGVLYVLEGSTMGGNVMKPRIAKQLGLTSGSGLNYYGCYGHQVRVRFDDFKSRMGTVVDGSGAEPRVLEAARNTFDRVGAVLRALVPE